MRALLDVTVWGALSDLGDHARFGFNRVQGHNQITDLYLLALAGHHRGCLATFDQTIGLSSVRGATARHLVLP